MLGPGHLLTTGCLLGLPWLGVPWREAGEGRESPVQVGLGNVAGMCVCGVGRASGHRKEVKNVARSPQAGRPC